LGLGGIQVPKYLTGWALKGGSSANDRPQLGEEGVRLRKPIPGPKKIYPLYFGPPYLGPGRSSKGDLNCFGIGG